jgi:hypothetical protein
VANQIQHSAADSTRTSRAWMRLVILLHDLRKQFARPGTQAADR